MVPWGSEWWDATSQDNVRAALAAIPGWLQLGNPTLGQIKIIVNSEGRTLSGAIPYGGPANFFSTNEGDNQLILYPQQTVFTIVHELGHAYNLRHASAGDYASVLLDPEMQSFMATVGWSVLTPAAQIANLNDHRQVSVVYGGTYYWTSMSHMDPLEDFANSFAVYFTDPGTLAVESPERFEWFAARF